MATKSESKTLELPALKIARMNAQIIGVSPLICNRFSDYKKSQIRKGHGGEAKLKQTPRTPQEEFEDSIYRTPEGKPAFPAIGLKLAMKSAAIRYAANMKYMGPTFFGAFSIPPELLELDGITEPQMRCDRVRLSGVGRTTSLAYRAAFMPWSMQVPLVFNYNVISPEQLLNALKLAGFHVGIGDWRMECDGNFGLFEIGKVVGI